MRTLEKNKRKLHYAVPVGETRILDEYGNETLEIEVLYSDPIELKVNYSGSIGRETIEIFGTATNYSRILCFTQECPLTKGCILWINTDIDQPANYKVVRVADELNSTLVAVQELA
jgi:hypothetical protein